MTDGLIVVAFEARCQERNCHRWYEVVVGRDLLDDWTVTIRYGRDGQGGQERRYAGPQVEPLRRVIRRHLVRRLSARRRIGVGYRLVRLDASDGLRPADWLPADVIGRFQTATQEG